MKIGDLARLGWKFMPKFSWIVALFIGVAVYGFVVVGSATILLNEEKSQPSELQISGENITDATIVKIADIPEVVDVSPVIAGNSFLKYGDYTGDFAVTGINPQYIEGLIGEGSVFPADTAMPYFVMNTAALEVFMGSVVTDSNYLYDAEGEREQSKLETEDVDWFSQEVEIGEDGRIIGKVCGIIKDDSEMPAVYLSVNSAKNILSPEYTGAVARIVSSGHEGEATKAISALNLFVNNTNTEQIARWESRETEVLYLFLSSLCLFVSLMFILYIRTKTSKIVRNDEIFALRICGAGERDVAKIYRIGVAYQIAIGIVFGVVLALCVPSFISPEEMDSIFALNK